MNTCLLVAFAIAVYCPVHRMICLFTLRGFRVFGMRRRGKSYWFIHLATFSRVGTLNKSKLDYFNSTFVSALESAVQRGDRRIVFRSHLVRPGAIRLAAGTLTRHHCRYRVVPVEISRTERIGISLQMLLQEWRRVTVSKQGMMFVIDRQH